MNTRIELVNGSTSVTTLAWTFVHENAAIDEPCFYVMGSMLNKTLQIVGEVFKV